MTQEGADTDSRRLSTTEDDRNFSKQVSGNSDQSSVGRCDAATAPVSAQSKLFAPAPRLPRACPAPAPRSLVLSHDGIAGFIAG